jgi:hypothetical protein
LPNLIITAGLIVLAVLLARLRGFSPLELFSRRADKVFVATVRNRWPVTANASPE